MIVPAEVDDAVDALRGANAAVGVAIDALNTFGGFDTLVEAFRKAHEAAQWAYYHADDAVDAASRAARERLHMEAVEERRIDCGTFDWVNET